MRQTHIKAATSLLCLFHWNVWAKTIEPINPWDMEQITDTRPICTYQDTEWRAKEWRFGENMFGFNEAWWWDIERGDKVNVTRDGYVMQIFLGAGKGYNDTALVSKYEWRPPVSAMVNIVSTGAPGIPSTFNFRRDSTPGWKEIDFIIASRQAEPDKLSHFISAPLFVPSDGATGPLRTLRLFGDDPEIDFELGPDTRMETNSTGKAISFDPLTVNNTFQENWALTWDGFDPTAKDSTYAINWLPDRIDWYAGRGMKPPLRVSYKMKEKHKDVFPTKGPFPYVQIGHSTLPPSAFLMLMDSLPFMPTSQLIVDSLRIGPWEAGGDWAGEVNWKKYPTPVMKIGKLAVRGCRIQKPVVDP